jgi:hypothetical protein
MQQETIHLQRAAPQVCVTNSGATRLCPDERAALQVWIGNGACAVV